MNENTLVLGLTVGHLIGKFEQNQARNYKTAFTSDYEYDGEMLELAEQLIKEFQSSKIYYPHYFSDFVTHRLNNMKYEKDTEER